MNTSPASAGNCKHLVVHRVILKRSNLPGVSEDRLKNVSRVAGCLGLLIVHGADAQTPLVLEKPDNPAGIPVDSVRTSPPMFGRLATPAGVRITQVNVTEAQQNILGDAANEPSLAHDPTAPSRIAAGWRQFDTISSNFRQAGTAWSNDSGRTWHASTLDAGNFRSDPVLRATTDGRILYNSITGDFLDWFFESVDGGQNWSEPYACFGGDKTWFAIDKSQGAGRNFLYLSWNNGGNNYSPSTFARSIDGGRTFGDLSPLPNQPAFGTNYVGPDGELYIFGSPSTTASASFFILKSVDANNALVTPTFTSKTLSMGGTIRLNFSGSPNPGGLLGQSQVVVDTSDGPRRGWVYLIATVDPTGVDSSDITFSRSTNGGVTFSAPVRINPEAAAASSWQWFGTLGISPGGRLDVVYNSTDGTGNVNKSKMMYISSADGGTNWSAPLQVTDVFTTNIGYPAQNKIGDYYDMESDEMGISLIASATFTGGQDVYYIRIGPEDCNRNGQSDSIDIEYGFDPDCNHNGVPDSCDLVSGFATDFDVDGRPDGCIASCAADFNLDGLVEDKDFVMFADSYDVLLCPDPAMPPFCRADLNHDLLVDDTDFTLFASAYNALLCP